MCYRIETVNVDLMRKPAWLFDLNPTGLVPILEWDGHVIYESAACNDYLDETFPGPKLNPSDPYRRARDRQLWESMGKVRRFWYNVHWIKSADTVFVLGFNEAPRYYAAFITDMVTVRTNIYSQKA